MKTKFSPPRYSRASQTGWDNSLISQENNVTVTLTIEELETLFQAALEGQSALRSDIDSMQADPDVERHEITHFRAKLYRTKAILDEVEKRMIFADKKEPKDSTKQGDFSAWEKFPGGF